MAEHPLDGLDVRPGTDRETRCCVPQFVRRQPILADHVRGVVEPTVPENAAAQPTTTGCRESR